MFSSASPACITQAYTCSCRCKRGGHRRLYLHIDPLAFITPPLSSHTTPSSSPSPPLGHTHTLKDLMRTYGALLRTHRAH